MSSIPPLPAYNKLLSELEPFYSELAAESVSARRHPIHHTNETQVCLGYSIADMFSVLFTTEFFALLLFLTQEVLLILRITRW